MNTVLYVEDNPQNMRLVRKILKHAGYEVLEAEDGATGLKVAEEGLPDLILMDINLPDMDGLQVTAELKKNSVLASIPVIALTANAMVGDREKALEAGCDGYLPKPINRVELLETIAEFIAKRK
jgi:two-component system cell cycle response regulator DivK